MHFVIYISYFLNHLTFQMLAKIIVQALSNNKYVAVYSNNFSVHATHASQPAIAAPVSALEAPLLGEVGLDLGGLGRLNLIVRGRLVDLLADVRARPSR